MLLELVLSKLDLGSSLISNHLDQVKVVLIPDTHSTKRFTDWDKLNLVKFASESLVLGLIKFSMLPQKPQIRTLASKVVRRDSKIIMSIH